METLDGKKSGRAGLSYETCVKELRLGGSSMRRFFKELNLYFWVATSWQRTFKIKGWMARKLAFFNAGISIVKIKS